MCRSSNERGGPRRCSNDTRSAFSKAKHHLCGLAATYEALTVAAGARRSDLAPGSALPLLSQYRVDAIESAQQAAVRFAQTVLEPDVAVIVDTETTAMAGSICEIAVISAHDGKPLLNTLVNPGVPMAPAAQAIHGISDEQAGAAGVPAWTEVYPDFERITAGRILLAYNANYDRMVISQDCRRLRIPCSTVTHDRWADVMAPRSDYLGVRRFLRNGGGHRALDDVLQTRNHLLDMAAGPRGG